MTRTPPHLTAAEYVKAGGDPDAVGRILTAKAKAEAVESTAKPKPKAKPPLAAVLNHPSVPRTPPSRGPWVLSIEGLGRPMTTNAERASSMSQATMARVRQEKRTWGEAVAQAARDAGIPHLARAHVVIQPFYPTNVVPDPDGIAPAHKAALDGLVAAEVLSNDRRDQLLLGYHVLSPVTDGGPERLTVTVFPLP